MKFKKAKRSVILWCVGVCLFAMIVVVLGVNTAVVHIDEVLNKEGYENLDPLQLFERVKNQDVLVVTCETLGIVQQEYGTPVLKDAMAIGEWNVKRRIVHSSDNQTVCIHYGSGDSIVIYENDTAYATYLALFRHYRIPEGTYGRLIALLQNVDAL